MFKTSLSVLALGLLVAGASAQVRFRLVKTVDLGGNGFNVTSSSSANYIGPHIYSITNDGGKVYVGGYNNSGATAGVGVLQINNFLGSTTVGRVAGSQSLSNAPIGGGYFGVAVKNGVLYANVQRNANTLVGDEMRAIDMASGTTLWDARVANALASVRVAQNVDIDPITGNVGHSGTLATAFTGALGQLDLATGVRTSIGTYTTGAVPGFSSITRGLAFDSNGDVYLRANNQVARYNRAAGSLTVLGAGGLLVGAAGSQIGQHIEVLEDFAGNKILIANNRSAGSTQAFSAANKMFRADGSLESVSWEKMDGSALSLADGNGIYSYSYDSAGKLLYVADSQNGTVHAFQAVPEPGTMIALVAGVGALVARRRSKN